MSFRPHPYLIVVFVGAALGLLFSSVSTYDFVMHLDRQVHDVHCSFVPGVGTESGASGCQVTLISSYSSVLRSVVWGGIPISLPAMGVFAFLLFFALELALTERQYNVRAAGFLLLATALPAVTSVVMAYISLVELDAVCKLCIGTYVASAIVLGGGIGLWLTVRRRPAGPPRPVRRKRPAVQRQPIEPNADPAWVGGGSSESREPDGDSDEEPDAAAEEPAAPEPHANRAPAVSPIYLAGAFGVGVALVMLPCLVYVVAAPDHSRFIGTCGGLLATDDAYEVMVPLDPHPGKPPAIEILDPLCPACRLFEERLQDSGFAEKMDRRALLFPLDHTCNWMIDQSMHPGACAVSKAMLCAGDHGPEVLEWAFQNQEEIHEDAVADPDSALRHVTERFPELAECVQSAQTESRLNRSLRWAVKNRLPVLTPQLYIGGVKLCDEDVDLGLEFTLAHMLDAYRAGTLRATDLPEPEAPLETADDKGARPTTRPADEPPEDTASTAASSGTRTAPETAPKTAPETAPETAPDTAPKTSPETAPDTAPPAGEGATPPADDKDPSSDTPAPPEGPGEQPPATKAERSASTPDQPPAKEETP